MVSRTFQRELSDAAVAAVAAEVTSHVAEDDGDEAEFAPDHPDLAGRSLVLREGLGVAALGTLVGLAAALALTRPVSSLLFEVSPRDPLTFGGVVALLACVAAAACLVPALRATRVDPATALRHD